MPLTAFALSDLEGEYVDGPSRTGADVELAIERDGERIVLVVTTKHPAAPDRSIRTELPPEDARELTRQLGTQLEA